MPLPHTKTRTVQFRCQDVCFFKQDGSILPHPAPLHQLLQANSTQLYIHNQKIEQHRSPSRFHMAHEGLSAPSKPLLTMCTNSKGLLPQICCCLPVLWLLGSRSAPATFHWLPVTPASWPASSTLATILLMSTSRAMALRLNNVGENLIKMLGQWFISTFILNLVSHSRSIEIYDNTTGFQGPHMSCPNTL